MRKNLAVQREVLVSDCPGKLGVRRPGRALVALGMVNLAFAAACGAVTVWLLVVCGQILSAVSSEGPAPDGAVAAVLHAIAVVFSVAVVLL